MWVRNVGHTRRSAMLDSAADSHAIDIPSDFVSRKPRPAAHPCLSPGEDTQQRYKSTSTFSLLCTRKCICAVVQRLTSFIGCQPQSCMLAISLAGRLRPRAKLAAVRRVPSATQRCCHPCSSPFQRTQKTQLSAATLVVVMQRPQIRRALKPSLQELRLTLSREVRQVLYSVLAASVRLASVVMGTHTNISL